ncbi:hypothetical protein AOQ84DRAFT_230282 [Glonium stellatum]|uniref:Uncharacterized protein n=1 Tax=Glonium stellatum TaxID=574774 RepID=A0A8E2F5K2_9PEZI|nr:hypothetical protein AOQ84DRAFT_230282 [Glonium stellatum]
MASRIEGPRMLWVTSRISRNDLMDEKTFLKWYNDDYIAEIMETDGIKNALRYINADAKAHMPYLAFYPMPDLSFTQGADFKKIRVHSDLLPGTGLCYDLADIDVRYIGLIEKLEYNGVKIAQCLVLSAIELGDGTSEEGVHKWFKEQTEIISKAQGHMRTTRYKLLHARTNAQSRALKGLPTADEPAPEPPTWMAIHEFSQELSNKIQEILRTDSSKNIVLNVKQIEAHIFKFAKVHGGGKFFE